MRFRQLLAVAALSAMATASHAAPVTFDFAGTIALFALNGTQDTTKEGAAFSGSYTVDLANVQVPLAGGGSAELGCELKIGTACFSAPGAALAPVVTAWNFSIAGFSFASDPGFDGRLVTSAVKNAGSQVVEAESNLSRFAESPALGVPGVRFEESFSLLAAAIGLNPGLLDSTTAPTLLTSTDFGYSQSVGPCVFNGQTCTGSQFDFRILMFGTLNAWTVREVPAEVPEPGSLLLVGIGLMGLASRAFARRRAR